MFAWIKPTTLGTVFAALCACGGSGPETLDAFCDELGEALCANCEESCETGETAASCKVLTATAAYTPEKGEACLAALEGVNCEDSQGPEACDFVVAEK